MTKKFLKSLVSVLLAVFMLVPLTMTTAFAADEIKLNKTSVSITEGKTSTLKVTGTSSTVTWSSSNKDVATVSKKGVVTANAVGNATITAKVGSKKLTCEIKVNTDKILTASSTVDIVKGDSTSVTIKIKDIDDIVCGTTDKSVATVKFNSKKTAVTIKAVGKGTANIKIYSKSNKALSRTIKVNVFSKVSSEKIVGTQKGDTYTNDYFKLKIDLSDMISEPLDYYYDDEDYQYFLLNAIDDEAIYALTVYDITKASKEMDGLKSNATASQFVDHILLIAFSDGDSTSVSMDQIYAMAALVEGANIKKSTSTIAGKKYTTLVISAEDDDMSIYVYIAAIKKNNHVLLIGSIATTDGAEKEFISRISALK